jgi:hypothetical protein
VLAVGVEGHRPVRLTGKGLKARQQRRPFAAVLVVAEHRDPCHPRDPRRRPVRGAVVDHPDRQPQRPGTPDHVGDALGVVVNGDQNRKSVHKW